MADRVREEEEEEAEQQVGEEQVEQQQEDDDTMVALDYGEEDLASMDTKESAFKISLQTLMGKQFETAVVAVGQVPTAFMDALMRDGEDATSSQDKPDPSTIVVTGHPPMRVEPITFTATFEVHGSVVFCKCDGMLRPEDAASFVNLMRSHVSAQRYVCLTEAPAASYQSVEPQHADPLIRYLKTSAAPELKETALLEPPNTMTSLPAALLSGCEWDGLDAYVLVSFRQGAGTASQLHVDYVNVFTPVLSLLDPSWSLDGAKVRAFCKRINSRPLDTLLYS